MAEPVPVTSAATGSRRRLFALFGVGAGLLLVALVAMPKLVGGGGSGQLATETPPVSGPRRAPVTTVPPAGGEPIETFEIFSTKNPFTPLVDVTAGGGGAAASTATGGGGASATAPAGATVVITPAAPAPESTPVPGGGTIVTTPPPTVPPSTTTTTTTKPPSTTTTTAPGPTTTTAPGGSTTTTTTVAHSPQRVGLLQIYQYGGQQVADVRVDDTVYSQLRPGDTFATYYQVAALSDTCGTFLYGDDRFRLCEGEEVVK